MTREKLTPEQITALAQENGPAYWRVLIESTFFILDKDSKKVPLIFTPAQNDYWDKRTPRDTVDKSRKLGFTTVELAAMIVECSQKQNRKAIVVSAEKEATERILNRAAEMIKNCAMDLGAEILNDTVRFKKTNSSIWIGTAGSKTFGRGDDINISLLTEFAHWEKPDLITGIEEACTRDSRICIESTANGYGNHFHKFWVRAIEQKPSVMLPDGAPRTYTPHFYGWNWDPMCFVESKPIAEYDDYEKAMKPIFNLSDGQIMWRRLKMRAMFNPNLFPQEYPLTWEESFLQSGFMVFDPLALQAHEKDARQILWQGEIKDNGDKAVLELKENGRLTIWVNPHKRDKYILTADVGAGIEGQIGTPDEGDYSVIDVYSLSNCEQVAQWRGHLAPDLFADVFIMLGAFYNWGVLVPEANNHGFTVCAAITAAEYPNYHNRSDNTGGTNMGWYTSSGKSGTRVLMVNDGRAAVRDFTVKINSKQTISECRTFVTTPKNEVGEAQIGCKDDCVIALCIGASMLKIYAGIPEQQALDTKPRLGYLDRVKPRATAPRAGGYK